MRRIALLWLAVATACAEPATEDLVLDLVEGDCTPDALSLVSVVSIEVWGGGGEGMCTLGKRCVLDIEQPMSVEGIEDAIAAVNQPLVDVAYEDARWVAIVGRTQAAGCFDGPAEACAFRDLADADEGTLQLTMDCNDCGAYEEGYPLCP